MKNLKLTGLCWWLLAARDKRKTIHKIKSLVRELEMDEAVRRIDG